MLQCHNKSFSVEKYRVECVKRERETVCSLELTKRIFWYKNKNNKLSILIVENANTHFLTDTSISFSRELSLSKLCTSRCSSIDKVDGF